MKYRVSHSPNGTDSWTVLPDTSTDRAAVTGLTNGVTRYFKVQSVSDITGLVSMDSAIVSATPNVIGGGGTITFPAWPVTVRDTGAAVATVDTDLHGKALPTRPTVNFSLPLDQGGYWYAPNDAFLDLNGELLHHMTSAGVIMYGNSAVIDFTSAASGNDGLKVDGGPATGYAVVRGYHCFGLAMQAGSHGDGIQGRGNIERLHMEDCYFDIPTGETFGATGAWSNSCLIMDNAQGDNGIVTAERCIFRGGNYALMVDDKNTGFDLPTYMLKDCAFIVESTFGTRSPNFGLITAGYESLFEFENCAVYSYDGSTCTFITNDVVAYSVSM